MADKKPTALQEMQQMIGGVFTSQASDNKQTKSEREQIMEKAIQTVFDPTNPDAKTEYNDKLALYVAVCRMIAREYQIDVLTFFLDRLAIARYSLKRGSRKEMVEMLKMAASSGEDVNELADKLLLR